MRRVLCIFLFFSFSKISVSQFGKDGILAVSSGTAILNQYASLSNNVTAGQNTISVTSIADLNLPSNLTCGDLVMIYQAQGASINTSNTNQYGTITGYGNAGLYELHHVTTVSSNTITLDAPLSNSYFVSGHTQVVKVPQYTTLYIGSLGSVSAPTWNGSKGGIVVIHSTDSITVNGLISATGKGFRGGACRTSGYVYSGTQYTSSSITYGGEKGESIAGSVLDYDLTGGRYCRGAPANGGGGGTNHNAGGGGGANAFNGNSYNGAGVMCTSCTGIGAWSLDADYIAVSGLTNSSGGGKGGNTYANSNQNALTLAPGAGGWSGDGFRNVGGRGGHPLTNINSSNRVYFGGGGGAGDANDNSGGNGAKGGGLVLLISSKIKGTGKIIADGDSAQNSTNIHADALGGGGGGGSVILNSSFVENTINVNTAGGKGGSMISNGAGYLIGSGAGGGGGYISYPTGSSPIVNVSGGLNGKNYHAWISEFPAYGATMGGSGLFETINSYSIITNYTAAGNSTISISSISSNSLCTGQSAIIYPTGSSNFSISPTNLTGLSFTVSPISTTSYTISDANMTCATVPTVITIFVNPTPTLTVNSQTICIGQTAILTPTSTTGYTWTPSGAINQSISVQPTSTTIYSVSSTNGTCLSTITATVSVIPVLPLSINNLSICLGQTGTLTASGATSYSWNTGAITSTISINPTTNETYTVIGTSGSCTNQAVSTVTVLPVPAVTVTGNTVICAGQTSSLNASGATSYSWSNSATTAGINVNPLVNTTYSVTGIIGGCSDQAIISVSVTSTPTISVVGNTTICSGQTSTLTVNGAQTYSWSTGSQNPTIQINPPVSTIFTLTGTTGSCSTQTTISVTVIPNPTLSITGNTTICSGQATTLTVNGAGNYIWDSGITTSSFSVSPTVTTTYTVMGASGPCSSQTLITVNVNPLPNVTITGNTLICLGETSTLTANGANTYTWSTGSSSATIFETPITNNSYSVTGMSGNCTNTAVTTVSLSTLSTSGNTLICNGESTLLSASGAGSYLWSTGATSSSITVHPQATTNYSVTGTVGSCAKSSVLTVSVIPSPVVTANNATICPNQNALLVANGADSYIWSNGSVFNLIRVSPTITTTYTVIGTIGSCTNNAVASVSVLPGPTALYSVTSNPVTSTFPFADFTNQSVNFVKWWWYFGDSSPVDTVNLNPLHYYNTDIAMNYPSSLTVVNSYGCMSTFNLTIKAEPEFTFYIPNAFSPTNNDGINDVFTGYGVGIQEFNMLIFDRWGKLIYSTNDITNGWNGRVYNKLEIVPQDSYVWKVEIKDVLGKDHFYVGHVTLFK